MSIQRFWKLIWIGLAAAALCFPAARRAPATPAGEPAPVHSSGVAIPEDELYDYVIIVPSSDFFSAVDPLKAWKELLGFKVKVVTTAAIYDAVPSGDNAERIWTYLHNHYPLSAWGIRYVLLIGDINQIPMRYLYPNGKASDGGAYGSDYYYANLDQADWDVDNDDRWGEFSEDSLDLNPEVIVGRVPLTTTAAILSYANSVIDYESDIRSWKRQALLVHGVYDYQPAMGKTDTAVLAEKLKTDFFDPFGWGTTDFYEQDGLNPSSYSSDFDLNQTDYENACGMDQQGLINLIMHGNVDSKGMSSLVWSVDANSNGLCDAGPPTNESGWSGVSDAARINTHPTNALVFLNGCSTAAVMGDDPNFASSPLRSRYLNQVTRPDIMVKEYLENGSPAVIGSTAGSDYGSMWDDTSDDAAQTLGYLFYRRLILDDGRAGDAFFGAQKEFAQAYGLKRGIRVFNYFGDPALIQPGVEERPGGNDRLIKEGNYKVYAADYDDNGDMYVGVAVDTPSGDASNIGIYRSSNHGENWGGWTTLSVTDTVVMDLDLLVGRFPGEDDRLHVIYTTTDGRVFDRRINLNDPDDRPRVQIADYGIYAKNVSAARDPGDLPFSFNLYSAWEYEENGEYYITIFRSINNGGSWSRILTWPFFLMPSITVGANDVLHLAALIHNDDLDVVYARSTDQGANWSTLQDLTGSDAATLHTAPDVGASTDPSAPGVWVAYDYEFQDPQWGNERDLHFAYSADSGVTWTKDRVLSADPGVEEWIPDLNGIHTEGNRWVNLAYNADNFSTTGDYQRLVYWRWSSGGLSNYWAPKRIVNDFNGDSPFANGPLVLYSPGAPASGSGVVYGGEDRENLYFSAPWLSGALAPKMTVAGLSPHMGNLVPPEAQIGQAADSAPAAELPLVWQPAEAISELASAAVGLAPGAGASLYAAAVLDTPDGPFPGDFSGHQGKVYRSLDWGASWQPTGALGDAWSLSSLIRTRDGSLLAGGMALEISHVTAIPSDSQPYGVIYRSTNNGDTWDTVHYAPDQAIYRLYQDQEGRIFAGTGWQGLLLSSPDDGQTWSPAADFGSGGIVRAILRSSSGVYMVGLEAPAGGKVFTASSLGGPWSEAGGLAGVLAVNDLLDAPGMVLAAVRTASGGGVYQGNSQGGGWAPGEAFTPAVQSVSRLYLDPLMQVYAGADLGSGPAGTLVYRKGPGSNEWKPYRGWLDLAGEVYDLLSTEQGLFAASGPLYGTVFRVIPNDLQFLRLPLVMR